MRILRVALLLVHAFVVSRLASGAAVDRYETERQHHTAVITLLDTTRNDRTEPDAGTGVAMPTVADYGDEDDDEEYYDYGDEEDDYGLSGDYEVEVPRVAMSSKPKDPSPILDTEKTEGKRRTGNGRKRGKGKGKGRKRNPCLKKYKNYCIHGTCQFHRELNFPACVCHPNYSGARCEFATLRSRSEEGYNRTTALAVVAVVLSSLCLTIIGLLLALRFHKRGAYDVESEEKVKLGLTPNH